MSLVGEDNDGIGVEREETRRVPFSFVQGYVCVCVWFLSL